MTKFWQFIYDWLTAQKFNYTEPYSYETAPYCGHHYSGHSGKYTMERLHEGYGGYGIIFWLFEISFSTEEDGFWWYLFPVTRKKLKEWKRRRLSDLPLLMKRMERMTNRLSYRIVKRVNKKWAQSYIEWVILNF